MRRRFARYKAQATPVEEPAPVEEPETSELPGIDPLTGRPRRFAYPPQLVVVDGGQPQVNAVAAVLSDLGITDVALCGLAKRLEEVWLPGDDFPVILPRTSEALYLLQRVRDEAHRFAITFHRQRRSKRMTESALDNVPGLGETRRKALLRHFGSLKRLAAATPEEVAEVPGIGRRTAETVLAALNPRAAAENGGGDQ
jgi:excinuclease ABC subunit C